MVDLRRGNRPRLRPLGERAPFLVGALSWSLRRLPQDRKCAQATCEPN